MQIHSRAADLCPQGSAVCLAGLGLAPGSSADALNSNVSSAVTFLIANRHALSCDQVLGPQACRKTAGLLTYVHKGLLYVSQGWDWRLCVVLMPEPGMNGLQ